MQTAPPGHSLSNSAVAAITGGAANRYSLTDASGNGYGLYLLFSSGELALEEPAYEAAATECVDTGE